MNPCRLQYVAVIPFLSALKLEHFYDLMATRMGFPHRFPRAGETRNFLLATLW